MKSPDAMPLIDGLSVVDPVVYEDDRGHFFERYNAARFEDLVGRQLQFVQDNESESHRNVLRGLHYQIPPSAQGKLVSCVRGAVFDVAVDIRRSSTTFGQWFGTVLDDVGKRQLWIPEGFAHGFLALTEGARLLYKTTDYYDPRSERSIRWDDPAIGIAWPLEAAEPVISSKDSAAPALVDAEVFA